MAPIVAAVVGVAYSAYAANKQKQQQADLAKKQAALAAPAADAGKQLLGQGQQAISPALNYYTSMMANPREATAPEQNRIAGMYSGSVQNALNQGPRGGAFGPSTAGNIWGQEKAQQGQVIQNARPQAANSLSSMGQGLTSSGMQGLGMGAGIYGSVFNQGLNANNQQYQQGMGAGNSLFNAYQQYLMNQSAQGSNQSAGWGTTAGQASGNAANDVTGSWGNGSTGSGGLYGGTTVPNSGTSGGMFGGPHG